MAITDAKLYKFHVANIHSIEIALNHAALAARKAIAEENDPAIKSFISLYAFLLGAWFENRLSKLLYEPNAFEPVERNAILAQDSQFKKWVKLIDVAFRKHYNVPHAPLTKDNIAFTTSARYEELNNILEQDLKSVIEIRNRLAHGQWIYPFNSTGTDIETSKFQLLQDENLPSLQYKKTMLTSLTDILHDLVVSLPTFERDFDTHYRLITTSRNNLHNRSYENYADQLIRKRQRGKILRRARVDNIDRPYKESIFSSFIKFLGICRD